MAERFFDEDDAHFTGTFGKWLDTHARLDSVTAALAADAGRQRIDVAWSIAWLPSSSDFAREGLRPNSANRPDPPAPDRPLGPPPRDSECQTCGTMLYLRRARPRAAESQMS